MMTSVSQPATWQNDYERLGSLMEAADELLEGDMEELQRQQLQGVRSRVWCTVGMLLDNLEDQIRVDSE